MKKAMHFLLICLFLTVSGTIYAAINDPTDITGNVLWLDANDTSTMWQDAAGTSSVTLNGDLVVRWDNKGSAGGYVVAPNSGIAPNYNTSTSLAGTSSGAALWFQGDKLSSDYTTIPLGISGNDDRTVISVWSDGVKQGSNYQHTFHMGNMSGNQAYGQSAFRDGNSDIGNHYWGAGYDTGIDGNVQATMMAISTWDGDAGSGANGLDSWWVNGASGGSSDRGALNTGTNEITIGSRLNNVTGGHTEGIQGNIAEIIVYDSALSPSDMNAVGWYLSQKWGLSTSYTQPVDPGTDLYWDTAVTGTGGPGIGNWNEDAWLDGVGGTDTNTHPQINVSSQVDSAFITSGTVTVNATEDTYDLTMSNIGGGAGTGTLDIVSGGNLTVHNNATISNSSVVNITDSTMNVVGTLQIDSGASFNINNLGHAIAGALGGNGTATLAAGSKLTASGGTLGAITLTGNAEVEAGGTISIAQLNSGGSTLTKSGGGTLDVTGTTSLTGPATYDITAGTLQFSGQLNGTGGVTKNGDGTLLLSNNNSYTGVTTINNGLVHITNNGGLGATGAGNDTVVNSGGTLVLSGGITTGDAVTINGNGEGGTFDGSIYTQTGSNHIGGLVSTTGNTRIRVAAGASAQLHLDGGFAINNNVTAILQGGGEQMHITAPITGGGALTLEGDGTTYIRAESPSYTGNINLTNGRIDVDNRANALGSAGTLNIDGDATLLVQGGVNLAKNITLNGTANSGNGQNEGRIHSGNNTNTLSGTLAVNDSSRIDVNGGSTLNLSGVVSGGGAIEKTDTGQLNFNHGSNSFSGALNIAGGTVNAVSGALSNTSAVNVGSGTTLNIDGGSLNSLAVQGTTNATTSPVTINNSLQVGAATYQVNSAPGSVSVSGVVNNVQPENLILSGADVTVTTPALPTGMPTTGLIGMWTFDDGTATDLSGNGHNGVFQGTPTISNADLYHSGAGQSLNTNGNSSVIIGGNEADFDTGDALTVAAWVKEMPDGSWEPYISKNGEGGGWQVRRHGGSDNFSFTLRGTSGHDDGPEGTEPLGDVDGSAGWMHVVARYDGTTEQLRQLIIDGDTATPDISIADTGNMGDTGSSVVFGARDNNGVGWHANVKLDDIFIYDRWLDNTEVAALYNSGTALTRVNTTSAVLNNLEGTGSLDVTGTAGLQVNGGISPGVASSIGTISVDGDVTLAGSLLIDLDPTGDGSADFFDVLGDFDITSGTVEFNVLGTEELDDEVYIFAEYDQLVGESFISMSSVPENYEIDYNWDGLNQIALFTTIPEPSTIAVWMFGLLGFGWFIRRKN